MNKRQIEKLLKSQADSFTPDIFYNVAGERADGRIHEEKHRSKPVLKFAAAFIIILIFAACAYWLTDFLYLDTETVYLEVNPSFELDVNRLDRVRAVRYMNEDAEELFRGYNPKGKKIDAIVAAFIDRSVEKGYIKDEEDVVYISSSAKNSSRAEKILSRLSAAAEKRIKERNIKAVIQKNRVSKEEREKARELNVSPAKLKIINEIISYDSSYTVEDLKDKTVRELLIILRDLRKNKN